MKEGQPAHQTPQLLTGKAAKANVEGKADRNTETTPVEGEGTARDDPGYNPTPEDLRLREVYRGWVQANTGTHLDGGIRDDSVWQAWWRELAVMTSRRYDTPSGRVGRRFIGTLGVDLKGVRDRLWNLKQFIVFQTVILQRARYVTASQAIRRRIGKRLDAWAEGKHSMLVEDTLQSCGGYITVARREDTAEHRAQTYHSLVLRGKLQTAVQWITKRETGGVLKPGYR